MCGIQLTIVKNQSNSPWSLMHFPLTPDAHPLSSDTLFPDLVSLLFRLEKRQSMVKKKSIIICLVKANRLIILICSSGPKYLFKLKISFKCMNLNKWIKCKCGSNSFYDLFRFVLQCKKLRQTQSKVGWGSCCGCIWNNMLAIC